MKRVPVNPGAAEGLEIAAVLFGLGLLGGAGALLAGRVAGGMQRSRRHAEAAPADGSVSDSRHHHMTPSAR